MSVLVDSQEYIVYCLVRDNEPLRTEELKKKGLERGVSCADRYLRYLAEQDKIYGVKETGNKTKTWRIRKEIAMQKNDEEIFSTKDSPVFYKTNTGSLKATIQKRDTKTGTYQIRIDEGGKNGLLVWALPQQLSKTGLLA